MRLSISESCEIHKRTSIYMTVSQEQVDVRHVVADGADVDDG